MHRLSSHCLSSHWLSSHRLSSTHLHSIHISHTCDVCDQCRGGFTSILLNACDLLSAPHALEVPPAAGRHTPLFSPIPPIPPIPITPLVPSVPCSPSIPTPIFFHPIIQFIAMRLLLFCSCKLPLSSTHSPISPHPASSSAPWLAYTHLLSSSPSALAFPLRCLAFSPTSIPRTPLLPPLITAFRLLQLLLFSSSSSCLLPTLAPPLFVPLPMFEYHSD
ncbi:unnamed protein product [Closterium sp. NIES-54]